MADRRSGVIAGCTAGPADFRCAATNCGPRYVRVRSSNSGMYLHTKGAEMSDLAVVRLLQNPLGQQAPAGHRGDIVRVNDGRASIYLFLGVRAADQARLR